MTKKLPLVTYAGEQIDPNLHYTELLGLRHFKDMPYKYKVKSAEIMLERVKRLKREMNDEYFTESDDTPANEDYHAMVLFEAVLIYAAGIHKDIVESKK